jgi:hypothetical protein
MTIKKTLTGIVLAGALSLSGCGDRQPQVKKVKDFTGDNIPDVMLSVNTLERATRGDYLFIGQEDGNYIRARAVESGGVKYFKTDDGVAYFFDGEFYKPLPKQD